MTTDSQELAAQAAPGGVARAVLRRATTASLATSMAEGADGSPDWPYASLVLSATDHAGRPLLLLSDLAVHTRALKADNRAALLFDATAGLEDPLTGARATVLGRVEAIEDDTLLARFVARHPGAAGYAGFGDFKLYRMMPERAHLVAGFGRISWIEAAALLFDTTKHSALAEAEAGIVEHMNADHCDALEAYAAGLLSLGRGA
ncbi:MAG: pyridoxamine 5'-phosphate oxidase family protein [Proteobacteria bacterium]|nr:pyridoxamine 5'-phosphate oxidase family protein [Pseudomonadota bacterium]